MTENPYRYQIPGHHYVGDLPRRIIDGMMRRGEHVGVVGGRRCGKTSIIKVLETSLPNEPLARPVVPVPVYVSGLDRASPGALFREILRAMTAGLEGYQWSGFVREEEPFDAFKTALDGRVGNDLTQRHGSEWMAVIMIDEIDTLAERLDDGGYGEVFFGNLRHLVMEHELRGNFRLVVTGVNDLEGVINRGSPFNMLATVRLGILGMEYVGTLIGAGFPDGIPETAKERLVRLTGRHPYLLQGVLQKLWRPDGQDVNGEEVQAAAASFQQEHNDFARWFSVFDGVARKGYACLSAQAARGVSSAELARGVSSVAGRAVTEGEVKEALTVLVIHGVIEQDGAYYRVSGTMFRDWFDAHAPVATDDVFEILSRLSACIEGLNVPEDVRRRAQDRVGRARNLLGRGAGPDPGLAKKGGADALRGLWDIVKGLQNLTGFVTNLQELIPHIGTAAEWIRNLTP